MAELSGTEMAEHDAPNGAGETSEGDGGVTVTAASGSDGSEPLRPAAEVVAVLWRRLVEFVRADPGRVVEAAVSLLSVTLATALVLRTLNVELLWADTTPTGGDMGAHVWGPRYLLDNLLPQGRLSGWTPDWYNGFPAYQFYMVVPSLMIVALHVGLAWYGTVAVVLAGTFATVQGYLRPRLRPYRHLILVGAVLATVLATSMPYNRAFKLVTVIGLVGLPVACWAFAKLADLPFPAPPLAAAAALLFAYNREPLYNDTGNIIGGNFHSTMAGEFAFSISLTLSVLYLGVAARGLKTGRHRALAAALFALAGLCHLIPAFFVLACTAALLAVHPDRGRVRWLATMVPVAGLLTAFWVVPFAWRSHYVNDMGWEKLPLAFAESSEKGMALSGDQGSVWYYLIPPGLKGLMVVAFLGVILSIVRRYSVGMVLGLAWGAVWVAFSFMPQARLWNARLLPFMYLSVALLAAIGTAEVIRLLGIAGSGRPERPLRTITAPMASLAVFGVLLYTALPLSGVLEGTEVFGVKVVRRTPTQDGKVESRFWLFSTTSSNPVGGWAAWNYSGLERKQARPEGCDAANSETTCNSGGWAEYRDLMATMSDIGADPDLGCGRAFWEYSRDRLEGYGTPMAVMLLPYWTDGCIGSQEGLYFESTPSVPHHFLMQSELSTGPSNPQRGMSYPPFDIDAGVRHLQLLGVRYYMATSEGAVAAAGAHPDLTEVAVSGPWHIYLVAGSETVSALDYEPVVATGIDESQHGWLPTAAAWMLDPEALAVPIAERGPEDWARVAAKPIPEDLRGPVGWVRQQLGLTGTMDRVPDLPRQKLPSVEVSDIVSDRSSISFRVSRPGVPVLVKTSYFPNWVAEGADGPYRVTPNLMVVVPTSTEVKLEYSRTPIDLAATFMSLLGLVGLLLLARRPQVEVAPWSPGPVSVWLDDLLSLPDPTDTDTHTDSDLDGPDIDDPDPGTADDVHGPDHDGGDRPAGDLVDVAGTEIAADGGPTSGAGPALVTEAGGTEAEHG
ncbi:MAG: hypothetical protein WBB52_10180 [Acidimicrobiales bacterium]